MQVTRPFCELGYWLHYSVTSSQSKARCCTRVGWVNLSNVSFSPGKPEFDDSAWPSPPAPLPSRSVASAVSLGEGRNSRKSLRGLVPLPPKLGVGVRGRGPQASRQMANVSEYEFRQQHQNWGKGLGDGGQTLVELTLANSVAPDFWQSWPNLPGGSENYVPANYPPSASFELWP